MTVGDSAVGHVIKVLLLVTGLSGFCLGSCPEGFTNKRSNGPCYKVFRSKANWTQAREICLSLGGDLIKVDDPDTYTDIQSVTTSVSGSKYYWIGLNDLVTEGSYYWLDGTPMKNPKWDPEHNQPNGGLDQNCTVGNKNNHLWEDKACADEFPFLCEYWLETPVYKTTHIASLIPSSEVYFKQHFLKRTKSLGAEDCLRQCLQIRACDRITYQKNAHSSENCFLGFFGPRPSDFPTGPEIKSYTVHRH